MRVDRPVKSSMSVFLSLLCPCCHRAIAGGGGATRKRLPSRIGLKRACARMHAGAQGSEGSAGYRLTFVRAELRPFSSVSVCSLSQRRAKSQINKHVVVKSA